jgi:hypothetical protein
MPPSGARGQLQLPHLNSQATDARKPSESLHGEYVVESLDSYLPTDQSRKRAARLAATARAQARRGGTVRAYLAAAGAGAAGAAGCGAGGHFPVRQPAQRCASGTPASAESMCMPQPAHVAFLHETQSTLRHMARRELREKEERSRRLVRDSRRRSGDKREKKKGGGREELAQIIHQPCMLLHSAIDSPAYSWSGEGGLSETVVLQGERTPRVRRAKVAAETWMKIHRKSV